MSFTLGYEPETRACEKIYKILSNIWVVCAKYPDVAVNIRVIPRIKLEDCYFS